MLIAVRCTFSHLRRGCTLRFKFLYFYWSQYQQQQQKYYKPHPSEGVGEGLRINNQWEMPLRKQMCIHFLCGVYLEVYCSGDRCTLLLLALKSCVIAVNTIIYELFCGNASMGMEL